MYNFLNGMTVALCAVAAVLFLKFWSSSHDRLFIYFAAAFCVLSLERTTLIIVQQYVVNSSDYDIYIYLVRLMAYLLLIIGIIEKNRSRPATNPPRTLQ